MTVAGGYTLQFMVPPYLNPTTLKASAGTFEILLKEGNGLGKPQITLGSLAISDLPQTGLAAGTLVNDFYNELLQLLSTVDRKRCQEPITHRVARLCHPS